MKCLICNNYFSKPKTFSSFFSNKELFICDNCYKSFAININYNVIPLNNNHNLFIYSLFEENNYFKGDPFILEFSQLFKYVYNQNQNRIILVDYNIYFTNEKFKIYDNLSKLLDDDIYILCNFYEIWILVVCKTLTSML